MKMLIEIYMDGYKNEEEMCEACTEYVPEQLDSSAISCKVLWAETPKSGDIWNENKKLKEEIESLKEKIVILEEEVGGI